MFRCVVSASGPWKGCWIAPAIDFQMLPTNPKSLNSESCTDSTIPLFLTKTTCHGNSNAPSRFDTWFGRNEKCIESRDQSIRCAVLVMYADTSTEFQDVSSTPLNVPLPLPLPLSLHFPLPFRLLATTLDLTVPFISPPPTTSALISPTPTNPATSSQIRKSLARYQCRRYSPLYNPTIAPSNKLQVR